MSKLTVNAINFVQLESWKYKYSKQEWNLFHDVSGLKNILWLILVSKLRKKINQDVEYACPSKVFSFEEVLRCKHT